MKNIVINTKMIMKIKEKYGTVPQKEIIQINGMH